MTGPAVIHRPRQPWSRVYRVSVDGETVGYVYPDPPGYWCAEAVDGERTRCATRKAAAELLRKDSAR